MMIVTNYQFKNIVTSNHSVEHLQQISDLFQDHIVYPKAMKTIMLSACQIVANYCKIYPGKMTVSFSLNGENNYPYYPIFSVTSSSSESVVYQCGYDNFHAVPELIKLALIEVIKSNFIF